MSEKVYKFSTVLKYIEKYYENVLTEDQVRKIRNGLNELER